MLQSLSGQVWKVGIFHQSWSVASLSFLYFSSSSFVPFLSWNLETNKKKKWKRKAGESCHYFLRRWWRRRLYFCWLPPIQLFVKLLPVRERVLFFLLYMEMFIHLITYTVPLFFFFFYIWNLSSPFIEILIVILVYANNLGLCFKRCVLEGFKVFF